MSFCHLELDANKFDVPVSDAGDVLLSDEGRAPLFSVVCLTTSKNPMLSRTWAFSASDPHVTRFAVLHPLIDPFVLEKVM